ncbi:hypothetical protein CEXT_661681 [Caerostris extrusa]|uniref:Uncharacterized protein n=1 Tax=Caerostris extrusa TaxID=172846 RepID=A0AAV4QT88_CAEEX|nr:hypothetical protein CEXT_661681 [Caerostris extrusa]
MDKNVTQYRCHFQSRNNMVNVMEKGRGGLGRRSHLFFTIQYSIKAYCERGSKHSFLDADWDVKPVASASFLLPFASFLMAREDLLEEGGIFPTAFALLYWT